IYLLPVDLRPSSRDVIVTPQMAGLHQMAESVSNQCLITEPFVVFSPNPVRILNLAAKAGFYSSGFGLLPYSISKAPIESFDICRLLDSKSDKSPISKDLQGQAH
ncbi:hypothetical protein L0244_08605, partial [bacterium]|nr:hypothetical protein [bacterium]